jgi:hypothetical protein
MRSRGSRRLGRRRAPAAWEASADPGFCVIDIDVTLIGSHSDKQGEAPNYKPARARRPTTSLSSTTRSPSRRWIRPRPRWVACADTAGCPRSSTVLPGASRPG